MLEILITGVVVIALAPRVHRIYKEWATVLPTLQKYAIQFIAEGKITTFLVKTYATNDEYDYDECQLTEIARDAHKNCHLRSAGVTDILIRNLDLDYQLFSVKLLTY